MPEIIERWKKGNPLTAKRLNESVDSINKLKSLAIDGPKQEADAAPPDVQQAAAEDETTPVASNVYTETSRTVSSVQIFDQNDTNYALIDRIESITLQNSEGDTLILQFNNPAV
jgi:hypothetical protein